MEKLKEENKILKKKLENYEREFNWINIHRNKLLNQIINLGKIPIYQHSKYDIYSPKLIELSINNLSSIPSFLELYSKEYNTISFFLKNINEELITKKRINIIRNMFNYIEKYGIDMINNNNELKNCIKKKLWDFKNNENLKEAGVWYRNIFKERIPINLP